MTAGKPGQTPRKSKKISGTPAGASAKMTVVASAPFEPKALPA